MITYQTIDSGFFSSFCCQKNDRYEFFLWVKSCSYDKERMIVLVWGRSRIAFINAYPSTTNENVKHRSEI